MIGADERAHTLPAGPTVFLSGSAPEADARNAEQVAVWKDDVAELRLCAWSDGKGERIHIELAVCNCLEESVRVRQLAFRSAEFRIPGDPQNWFTSTLSAGISTFTCGSLAEIMPSTNDYSRDVWARHKMEPRPLSSDPLENDGRWRSYTDTLFFSRAEDEATLGLVPVGEPRSSLQHACFVDKGRLQLRIDMGQADTLLPTGAWRTAQTLGIVEGCYEAVRVEAVKNIAQHHGVRVHRGTLFGWCSWYTSYANITAAEVISLAERLRALKDSLPHDLVQIDDGWQAGWGDWTAHPGKFPGGLEPVVAAIRAAGARPGIWIAPIRIAESHPLVREHPACVQRDRNGQPFRGGTWSKGDFVCLDPTHPAARKFIGDAIRNLRSLGFEYFKFDFNALGGSTRFHDPALNHFEIMRSLYQLYRDSAGEDAYLLACMTSFHRAVAGYADACRIGLDTAARWSTGMLCGLRPCIATIWRASMATGLIYAADPDVPYIKVPEAHDPNAPQTEDTLNDAEVLTWLSHVGLSGGNQIHSEPIQRESYAPYLRRLEVCRPPLPPIASSLHAPHDPFHQLIGLRVSRAWGDHATMLVYNANDVPSRRRILRSEILGGRGPLHVWSFWDDRYLGVIEGDFTSEELAPHACLLLRFTPVEADRPVLVGSNLHIGAGVSEIAGMAYTKRTITLTLTDAGARDGVITLASQRPLRLLEASGMKAAQVVALGPALWRLDLRGRERAIPQSLRLACEGLPA